MFVLELINMVQEIWNRTKRDFFTPWNWKNVTFVTIWREYVRGFGRLLSCFGPLKRGCYSKHQLTRKQSDPWVQSLWSWHPTHTHWGRCSVSFVRSPVSRTRWQSTGILSVEALLWERDKRSSWTVLVSIKQIPILSLWCATGGGVKCAAGKIFFDSTLMFSLSSWYNT